MSGHSGLGPHRSKRPHPNPGHGLPSALPQSGPARPLAASWHREGSASGNPWEGVEGFLVDEVICELQRRLDIRHRHIVLGFDIGPLHAGRQAADDDGYGDAGVSDYRLTVSNCRIDVDAVVRVHSVCSFGLVLVYSLATTMPRQGYA